MKRMRTILMTCDAVGGVWTYALNLARAFEESDLVRVVLAVLGPLPNASQRAAARSIRGLDLFALECRLEWMDDPWADVERSGEWLLDLEKRIRPDVIHLNMYAHGSLPFCAPVMTVAHSCVASWWSAVKKESLPARYRIYRDEVRAALASVRAVVAPTRAMLDAVQTFYGETAHGLVIHNGAPPWPSPKLPKAPAVLSLGRIWDEAKNIEALSAVAHRIPWPIYVAGSPAHPDGTDRVPHGVRALGWLGREALAGCLGRASIYAHPARYEPFGLAPLEAAHAGCALVLGDISSLREIWGDAALYVPPEDHDALAAAIRALIDDPALRVRMSERARFRARRFPSSAQARAYLNLYDRLMAPRLAIRRNAAVSLDY
ncbi:glycosyltransferase [Pendulispora albinea]|uniref:Glycosyltransferase n=1 Tax=Pendulispora albinea TaxID=2741071 RepID=A0ABZ2LZU8_9BACT